MDPASRARQHQLIALGLVIGTYLAWVLGVSLDRNLLLLVFVLMSALMLSAWRHWRDVEDEEG